MAYGSYTDYLEMLAAQPLDKLALVDDAASFTYGQLVAEAKKLRSSTTMDEPAVFIHEDTIAQQLLKFVAFSGTAMRPIIATELSKEQQFELGHIPERACMGVMLENDVVPVVNENDTVSVTELMFTDNDELSGLIATMMGAERLVILSNIDGIYTGSPADPQSKLITKVEAGHDLSEYIQQEKSGFGRGGMTTKCNIARKVADEGIEVIIANGKRDNILRSLVERRGETPHTTFVANKQAASGVKKWIAHSESFAKGIVRVNAKAAEALMGSRAVSLLMVGVTAVEGDFEEGDIVTIIAPDGRKIGLGRSAYSNTEATALVGKHDVKPIVHYDYLIVNELTS